MSEISPKFEHRVTFVRNQWLFEALTIHLSIHYSSNIKQIYSRTIDLIFTRVHPGYDLSARISVQHIETENWTCVVDFNQCLRFKAIERFVFFIVKVLFLKFAIKYKVRHQYERKSVRAAVRSDRSLYKFVSFQITR